MHPLPPNSFQPPPSSLHNPQRYKNQNIARNWEISPDIGKKRSKFSVLPENWHTWYLEGGDSKSGLRFSKILHKYPFLGKFEPKRSKLSVLPENWHTEDADSYSDISFLIF